MKKELQCKECTDVVFTKQGNLIFHVKSTHGTSYEEYVIRHFFNGIHPECGCGCGTLLRFNSNHSDFFAPFCKNHHPRHPHTEETKEKIKINAKKGMIEKYGVDNPMKLQSCIDKIANTKKERFGSVSYNNSDKNRKTKKDRYGNETFNNPEKIKKTNQEKYGANSYTASEEGKKQVAATKLMRYGNPGYNNMEKNMQTKQDKYGYSSEFLNPDWRNKYNRNYSGVQLRVANQLGVANAFRYEGYEFDMLYDGKYIIEVDGDYYHPVDLEYMNFSQILNVSNDYRKTRAIFNKNEFTLIRILASKIPKKTEFDFQFIIDNQYIPDYSISTDTVLIGKEFILKERNTKDDAYFIKKSVNFIPFLTTFYPDGSVYHRDAILHSIQKLLGNSGIENIDDISIRKIFKDLVI